MNPHIGHLITTNINSNIADALELRTHATYHIGKLSTRLRANLMTNLRRGWCSTTSGLAYVAMQILCAKYDIPLYAVGRTDLCVISIPNTPKGQLLKVDIDDQLKALWMMTHEKAVPSWWGWRNHTGVGHNERWLQMQYMRPDKFDITGMANMLKVGSVLELIDKKNLLAAMGAVEQGLSLDITTMVNTI